ncbi:MAG TPA: NAD(P)-binding protein [Actinomycetota bacterium]|nr:NAD(P)-binding protein [Actinomycetota bacterium]
MTRTNGIHPLAIDDPDAAPSARTHLPVVVIGAGPVGLAAAAHLLDRGLEPLVLEGGPQVGANIGQWRHVRLFSPWCLALDPVSVRLLDQSGWTGPDPDALPTGADLLEHYLQPLAALPALASRIQQQTPGTEIVWAVRSATPRPLVGKGSAETDELPARGRLATDLGALVEAGRIELVAGFRINTVALTGDGVRLAGHHFRGDNTVRAQDSVLEGEEVIAATGFRPDHAIATELRLGLDPALECPTALAPIIDPNVHTCGTVPAHGIAELAHPEPGFVVVGMKSYGRAPTFLLATATSRSARWWPRSPATKQAPSTVTRDHRPRPCAPSTGTCWPAPGVAITSSHLSPQHPAG